MTTINEVPLPDRWSYYGHCRSVGNSQGFRGVYFDREHSRWRAEIKFLGRRIKLGRFRSPESAAHAYNCAARKYYGEFAVLNQIGQSRVIGRLPEPLKRVKRRVKRFYHQSAAARGSGERP